MNRGSLRNRRITAAVALGASGVATALGLATLAAILWTLFSRGLEGLSCRSSRRPRRRPAAAAA